MNLDLKGKNALVCGSTGGIGLASALELALLGANVTLLARNEEKLKQTLPSLANEGTQMHKMLVGDLSVPESLSSVLGDTVRNGHYHILINNTGGPTPGTALDASIHDFESAFKSHLGSAQTLTQLVAPFMKAAQYGRIINVISTSVKIPIAGLGVSNTIRGAMASWAKTLSLELGPFGITVNNVLPGSTMTPRLMQVIKSRAEKQQKTIETVKYEMMMEVPAKRISEPHEVAAMIAFLASPAAGYVNGTSIPVDGGRTGSI
ncbi:MAG: SDR family oxidoreductase [Bacteroidetes bacterium]|nr:SDR family oxidoreductase [Bacteroidota bacterium]